MRKGHGEEDPDSRPGYSEPGIRVEDHSGRDAHRRLRLGWETLEELSMLLLPGTVIHTSSASVFPSSLELGKHNLAA